MSDNNMYRIGNREVTWFLVLLFISKILFADINVYVNQSGTAAYMQTAWCAILAAAIFSVTAYLGGGRDIFSAAEYAFGELGLKLVGILLAVMLTVDAGVMLRVYADIISSIVLPDAADFFIIVLLVAAAAFAAFAGVGTLVSYAYGAGIVLAASLIIILALNIPNYSIANMYPVLGNGADKILGGLDGINVYADIFLIFLMAVYFKEDVSIKKSGIKAIIIGGAVICATTFLYILTVPYPASTGFTLPVLEIAFDVNLDVIFQRAEGLFLFLWIFSGFILIGAYTSFALLAFEKGFRLSNRRAPIGTFLAIAASIALSADSSVTQGTAYEMFYNVFTAVAIILPLVIFIVNAIIRKVRG